MTIFRIHHDKENPYVILNKKSLWDSRLSLETVGLWARIMSRPDDWQIHVSELCKACDTGKDKMRRMVDELIAAGYCYKRKVRKDDGTFCDWSYDFFETPKTTEEIQKMFPKDGFPDLGVLPKSAEPPSANPPLLSNEILLNKKYTHDTRAREEMKAFGNIFLKIKEYNRLSKIYGEKKVEQIIYELDLFSKNNPEKFKTYQNHAATIESWLIREEKKETSWKKNRHTTKFTNSKAISSEDVSREPPSLTSDSLAKILEKSGIG